MAVLKARDRLKKPLKPNAATLANILFSVGQALETGDEREAKGKCPLSLTCAEDRA